MNSDIAKLEKPYTQICDAEFKKLFLNFCSFICIIKNKRLNLANIFLLVLKEEKIRTIFKSVCEIDNDYDAVQKFLEYDPSLYKSKYITKYINSTLTGQRKSIL